MQELRGGPTIAEFVPNLVARLKEEREAPERDRSDEAAARREQRGMAADR